jgi:hypothetical protein
MVSLGEWSEANVKRLWIGVLILAPVVMTVNALLR